ncbi:hypothetical protein ACFL96_13305 [Thermoproteota archaeon]
MVEDIDSGALSGYNQLYISPVEEQEFIRSLILGIFQKNYFKTDVTKDDFMRQISIKTSVRADQNNHIGCIDHNLLFYSVGREQTCPEGSLTLETVAVNNAPNNNDAPNNNAGQGNDTNGQNPESGTTHITTRPLDVMIRTINRDKGKYEKSIPKDIEQLEKVLSSIAGAKPDGKTLTIDTNTYPVLDEDEVFFYKIREIKEFIRHWLGDLRTHEFLIRDNTDPNYYKSNNKIKHNAELLKVPDSRIDDAAKKLFYKLVPEQNRKHYIKALENRLQRLRSSLRENVLENMGNAVLDIVDNADVKPEIAICVGRIHDNLKAVLESDYALIGGIFEESAYAKVHGYSVDDSCFTVQTEQGRRLGTFNEWVDQYVQCMKDLEEERSYFVEEKPKTVSHRLQELFDKGLRPAKQPLHFKRPYEEICKDLKVNKDDYFAGHSLGLDSTTNKYEVLGNIKYRQQQIVDELLDKGIFMERDLDDTPVGIMRTFIEAYKVNLFDAGQDMISEYIALEKLGAFVKGLDPQGGVETFRDKIGQSPMLRHFKAMFGIKEEATLYNE